MDTSITAFNFVGYERRTQKDSIDDDRLEELKRRLDRLESLIMELPNKLVAAESEPCLWVPKVTES